MGSNFEKPRTRQESVLCTKCSISYIISHRPVRGVYRETSSYSVIYAGKIAFFIYLWKLRGFSSEESVLCTKCSISYIISHRPVRGVYRETFSFSVIYAGKNEIWVYQSAHVYIYIYKCIYCVCRKTMTPHNVYHFWYIVYSV